MDRDQTEEERPALRRSVDYSTARVRFTDTKGPHEVLIADRIVVGSAETARIVVSDPTVSRVHLELDPRPSGLWVRDLGSRNGTSVGAVSLGEVRLAGPEKIRVGGVTLEVAPGGAEVPTSLWPDDRFGPLVGRSRQMKKLFATLARVASTEYSVLVQGETGSGKEVVARALHEASPRREGPLVVVDCAAIPEALFESQLFGHVRGAFTGAVNARAGDFEAAAGGTIFLDEVGELPASVQPKLLRVLESRTARRVGDTTARPVDVRVVSATHRDLAAMVANGSFREDLYFRLAVVPVWVPPLRERAEDIPLLAAGFGPRGTGAPSAELIADLMQRPWPGNVRQLRNFVERAVALGVDEALALERPASAAAAPDDLPPNPFATIALAQRYRDFREQWATYGERAYLEALLRAHDGNVAAAAIEAGLDRTHLYRMLRRARE